MRQFSQSLTVLIAAAVLGLPSLANAADDDEVKPAFRPIQANDEFVLAGKGFGLNPWGNIWAPSPFQWPFNNRVEPVAQAAFQPRQLVAAPPQVLLPPMGPVVFPRPRFPFPGGGGGGGGNMLPGQGASSGGDDSPAGVLLNVNYANMFGTAAQQLRPQQQNYPVMPYPYGPSPYYPYGGGFFPR